MAERDFSKPIVYRVDGMRNVRVQRDVVYKRDGDTELRMNIYSPARLSGEARVPAVFLVHGGPISELLTPPTQWGVFVSCGQLAAASALIGVTFNHRLYAPSDYERSLADVSAAIDYVREHAAELNIDADRIALWYFSGGGPLMNAVLRERPSYVRCVLGLLRLPRQARCARERRRFADVRGAGWPWLRHPRRRRALVRDHCPRAVAFAQVHVRS
jgi:dipeptidyl aminopeptidase/acylaminoacyl peptidase